MESAYLCVTCGMQYPASAEHPESCPICEDDRQYVGWSGQQWTTLEELRVTHRNEITLEEDGLTSIQTTPGFGINQRAFLVRTPAGNILWDCVALLDAPTVDAVHVAGGLTAIAISHPHYYSTMIEWSRAFGEVPIYLHAFDREWTMRRDGNVQFWSGAAQEIADGVTLVHCGGHFDGFQVLVWRDGADGRGVLLAGDQPQIAMDRKSVSFLYSYPNMIPLGATAVRRLVAALEPWPFDRQYGAFAGRTLRTGAKETVRWSAERYLRFIAG